MIGSHPASTRGSAAPAGGRVLAPRGPISVGGLGEKRGGWAPLVGPGEIEVGKVVHPGGGRREPYPPIILASSRTPICRISIRVLNSAASSLTRGRKST